jgi:hypothetical protein
MRYIIAILILASCNSPRQTPEPIVDSVSVMSDSAGVDVDEGVESALYTIEDQVQQMTFPFEGKTYDAQELLAVLYWPDQLGENTVGNDETPSAYIINDATTVSGNFFKAVSMCEPRTLLLTKRMEIDAEYYDLFFLEQEADGSPKVADRVSYDGSQGQSDTQLTVVTEGIGTDKTCYALKVASSTEGGDINLHRDSWVEYFIADGHGFHSVIKIVLEETDVQDYEASQDETKDSTSEIRDYEFLTSQSQGLYDIKIHTVVKQNGATASESYDTFRFDGTVYVKS